ncbi:MAG: MarR family transcriptional regulator [Clostridiales bacterium]|nr:MarR family transcriptional regulator [Clostridiales bacterium]
MEKQSFHYLQYAVHMMIYKQLFAGLKDTGLSIGQPKVLDYLRDHDGAVQKDIAKGCFVEPASLSGLLDGMEKKGLLRRVANESSRRSVNVFLTSLGWEQVKRVEQVFGEIEKAALQGFSAQECEQIAGFQQRIYENLEALL